GVGGGGVVWAAQDTRDLRPPEERPTVALKVLLERYGEAPSEDEVYRFRLEMDAARSLDHPNIVKIEDFGEHEGRPYYVMPLMVGKSLAHHENQRRFYGKPREAAKLVRTLALAMHHAHDRGFIHRDMKPGNVLFDARGAPCIADFGVAKR